MAQMEKPPSDSQQGVTLLKELLFSAERNELKQLYDRSGDDERLTKSVAKVLDGAMRQAEKEHLDVLSEAMAPMVVKTIKTEIHNSRDEMVEALYPITGRLVAAYVANAFKELMDKINARLDSGFSLRNLKLRLRSFVTGQPMAELALAGTQQLDLEELYLIRRGSGELVDRWIKPMSNGMALPAPGEVIKASNRDSVVAGFLAAINDFASDAFDADRSGLQTLDLQTHRVYLRASPTYLLAAKCSGAAPPGVERRLDTAFREALERNKGVLDWPLSNSRTMVSAEAVARQKEQLRRILPEMAAPLQERLALEGTTTAGNHASPRKYYWGLGLLAAGLLGWWLWHSFNSMQIAALGREAQMVVSSAAAFKGWPVTVDTAADGKVVSLTGLAPSEDAKKDLLDAVERTVAPATVRDELSVVYSAAPGRESSQGIVTLRNDFARLESQFSHSAVLRAVQRAERRTTLALADLDRLERDPGRLPRQALDAARVETEAAREQIVRMQRLLKAAGLKPDDVTQLTEPLLGVAGRLTRANAELKGATGSRPVGAPATNELDDGNSSAIEPAVAAEEAAFAAERLADVTASLEHAEALERRLAASDRQRLESWAKANAIFFGNDLEYRNAQMASAQLDQLAALVRDNALRLRIVGYTDGIGQANRNTSLAASRAEKVAEALAQRAISRTRLSVIGRANGPDLSSDAGPESPNRRVEFELAFEGERTSAGTP